MGLVGCYALTLYCDADHGPAALMYEYSADFGGHTYRQALTEARRAGWLVNAKRESPPNSISGAHSGYCLCPIHSGKRRAPSPEERADGE